MYSDQDERRTFQEVLRCLEARGGVANGRALVQDLAAGEVFVGPTDAPTSEQRVASLEEARNADSDESRLVEIEVQGAFRYDRKRCCRVTYLRVEPAHLEADSHPVAIWSTGDMVSGAIRASARRAGRELREVFLAVVEQVRPAYGAVTVDWPLLSPSQMQADQRAREDYRDFFLSESFAGRRSFDELRRAASDVETMDIDGGLFVFSSPLLGGSGTDHREASQAFTAAVARSRYREG